MPRLKQGMTMSDSLIPGRVLSEDGSGARPADGTVAQAPAFAAEFAPANREQWRKLVDEVLKGASYDRLVAKSYDGLAIAPLYERAVAARPVFGRRAGAPWQVVQRIDHPDPAAANAQALHDLGNGANGLAVVLAGSPGAYGFGLPGTAAALARVLERIPLDAGAVLDLEPGPSGEQAAASLAAAVTARGLAPSVTDIRFGIDPLGTAATGGGPPAIAPSFAATIGALAAQGYRGPFAVADGRVVHHAGGSEAQELAYVLAVAVAYWRALEAAGLALDDARRMIFFRLAADADQFLTMAKFRALRLLWARVEEACGLPGRPVLVAAETAWRMMTAREAVVNMLRATVAVVAAGLGGADSIAVVPHTMALGLPDAWARRIARNTQLILIEESNLARVADPAAGSGAFEALTQGLCGTTWQLFQAIERAGGAAPALESGLIQEWVAAVRDERAKAVARRSDALTGTSTFPDLAETPPAVLVSTPARGDTAFQPTLLRAAGPAGSARAAVLASQRLAEPFEALRDASDRLAERTGARPKIFFANLGRLADFTTPATFAKNLFEAGGIEASSNDGFATREDLVAAFKASGARLACLCGWPAVDAAEVTEAAIALRAAGAVQLYAVGRPDQRAGPLDAAGVNAFIYSGCDVLDVLRRALAAATP